jgi:hypothetical protein
MAEAFIFTFKVFTAEVFLSRKSGNGNLITVRTTVSCSGTVGLSLLNFLIIEHCTRPLRGGGDGKADLDL